MRRVWHADSAKETRVAAPATARGRLECCRTTTSHAMPTAAKIHLKSGREKSLLRKHPWVFSGAIARVEGAPESGDTVEIVDAAGGFLALAAYSPASQIRARVWSFAADELIDADFFR